MRKNEEIRNKIIKSLSADRVADQDFADIVYTALADIGLSEQAFRDRYGLSAGTVERWTQGQNLPLSPVRRVILEWLQEQMIRD